MRKAIASEPYMIARGRASLASRSRRRARCSGVGHSQVPWAAIAEVIGPARGRLSGGGPRIRGRWTHASWASSTSRPTRSPTAGEWFAFDRAVDHARSLVARGRRHRRHRRRVDAPARRSGRRRRGAAPRGPRRRTPCAARARRSASTPRSSTVAEAAVDAGATLRQRRHRLPPGARAGRLRGRSRLRLLPDAHAGRAAHDAGRPALRRRRRRRPRLPRGARRRSRCARACARSASWSTPGSGSARRSSTTSSSCAASTRSRRSASRWSSGPRASRSWAGSRGARIRTTASRRRWRRPSSRWSAGRSVFRVHDVAPTRDALTVATATLRADGA